MKLPAYKLLYIAWAVMFALTAALGFAFPEAAGSVRWVLAMVSALFFLPPALILTRAREEHNTRHIHLVRYLAIGSIVLTVGLLCANLMSAGLSEAMGNALYAALVVVSAPMVCSNFYVLPLFLWGTLLAAAFIKEKS